MELPENSKIATGYNCTMTPESYKQTKMERTPLKPQSQNMEDLRVENELKTITESLQLGNKRSQRTNAAESLPEEHDEDFHFGGQGESRADLQMYN